MRFCSIPDVFEHLSGEPSLVHGLVRRLEYNEITEFESIIDFLTIYEPVIDILSEGPGQGPRDPHLVGRTQGILARRFVVERQASMHVPGKKPRVLLLLQEVPERQSKVRHSGILESTTVGHVGIEDVTRRIHF